MNRQIPTQLGDRYTRLVVIEQVGQDKHHNRTYLCRCDCGAEKIVKSPDLRQGRTKSCGCLRREQLKTHGQSDSLTYQTWENMKQRSTNPKHTAWKDYGGRGITVCERWMNFENFLADMGERPEGLSLDRIDGNKGYEPSNCRWATALEQVANRRARPDKRVTHCPHGHQFTPETEYHDGRGRQCRICNKLRAREYQDAVGRQPCTRCASPKSFGRGKRLCDKCLSENTID